PGADFALDAQLEEQGLDLSEFIVQAGKEDPAYAVIRKAQNKRKFYRDQVEQYKVDVYIKGQFKLLDAPKKIFGVDLGEIDGTLDSNRQGILYLSETLSELYFMQPDKKKEVILSSKVSGNDRGLSFNRALAMDFDLYQENVNYGRAIVSPISAAAFNYYKFKLLGIFTNEQGIEVNKIELIPIRSADPVFRGVIYIVEDEWNIYSSDVYLTKAAMKLDVIDTLRINQTFVKINGNVWQQINQTLHIYSQIFGFKFRGNVSAVYSDYDLTPGLTKASFGNEIVKYEIQALKKDTNYWNTIRPIPLTEEEAKNYIMKDSIQTVQNSPAYKDSIQKNSNRYKFNNFLFGYTANFWKKDLSIYVGSILNAVWFHPVTGLTLGQKVGILWESDSIPGQKRNLEFQYRYGFLDYTHRVEGSYSWQKDAINYRKWQISGGYRKLEDFNDDSDLEIFRNSVQCLVYGRTWKKLIARDYLRFAFQQEVLNGLTANLRVEWNQKHQLENKSNYTWVDRELIYDANNQLDDLRNIGFESPYQLWNAGFHLWYKPGQKFQTLPDRKLRSGSPWPTFSLQGTYGYYPEGKKSYQQFEFQIRENRMGLGHWGDLAWKVNAGTFVNGQNIQFGEFKHFTGNQLLLMNSNTYLDAHKNLPYYLHSTNTQYVEAAFEYNLNGLLLDKIPLIKKAGLSEVLGANYIATGNDTNRFECNFGIDRIGYGLFRLLRIDVVPVFDHWKYQETRFVIGVNGFFGAKASIGADNMSIRN
ncbi:MAG: DUF5686 family protein, partial [Saprospiraceae bacterium]